MLRAVFIRHGKAASLLSGADYDALSSTGVEQSERLGGWLALQAVPVAAVFVGPRKRHADSYAATARASAANGHPLPAPTVVPDLDEHDAVRLVGQLLPTLAAEEPTVLALVAAVARGELPKEDDILAAFHGVARRWVAGDLPPSGVESWPAFRARILRALEQVATAASRDSAAGSPTALVFTSAGVIAAAVAAALQVRDDKAVDLSVAPYNTSLTELHLSDEGGWALRSFNGTPHLHESRLFTRL